MDPWKLVAALAIVVVGAVGAFAVYTVGWRDGSEGHSRVTVLRDGDVILRPEAATRCEASHEGGQPNLFCTRLNGGRHQVIFYRDDVLVWPLSRGPDGPPFIYRWQPWCGNSGPPAPSAKQGNLGWLCRRRYAGHRRGGGGSRRAPASALLGLCTLRLLSGASAREIMPAAEAALETCQADCDDLSCAHAWNLVGKLRGSLVAQFGAA